MEQLPPLIMIDPDANVPPTEELPTTASIQADPVGARDDDNNLIPSIFRRIGPIVKDFVLSRNLRNKDVCCLVERPLKEGWHAMVELPRPEKNKDVCCKECWQAVVECAWPEKSEHVLGLVERARPEESEVDKGLALSVPRSISAGMVEILYPESIMSSVVTRKCLLASDKGLVEHQPEKAIETTSLTTREKTTSSSKFKHIGQELVQVFSLCTNSPFVRTVGIYDDRRGKYLYRSADPENEIECFIKRKKHWLSRNPGNDPCDYMDDLVVSGPDCTMSARPGFIIEVDVNDENVFDLPWSWEDGDVVDKPVLQTIFTSRGVVHVTYAVLSDAVQASVEILFSLPEHISKEVDVLGELVLRVEGFDVGCKVFQNDVWRGVHSTPKNSFKQTAQDGERMVTMELPLIRDIFAVPVGCGLRLSGTLLVIEENTLDETTPFHVDCPIDLKDKWRVKCPIVYGLTPVKHKADICINIIVPF